LSQARTSRRARSERELEELVRRRRENLKDKIKFAVVFVAILVVFGWIYTTLNREATLGPIDMSLWSHRILVVCIFFVAFYLFLKFAYRYFDRIFFKYKTNTWELMFRRFKRNKAAVVGVLIIITLSVMAVFAGLLAPYPDPGNPRNYDHEYALQHLAEPPSRTHILGTTRNGKDMLSVLIHGSRISLALGLSVELTAAFIGTIVGSIAAYYGGWVDKVINVINDIVMAFPFLLFIIVLVAILRDVNIVFAVPFTDFVLFDTQSLVQLWNGLALVFLALAVLSWSSIYRVVRGQILSVKEMEFVEAARAVGAKDRRIIIHHILPNIISPIIVLVTLGIAGVILTEASLSYLGFGAQEGAVSWGRAIFEGRQYATTSKAFLVFFPGLAIVLSILGFNSFGDGLRDALDPRMKR
jgi:peptide/nickel transport system permease protein/oligopeptide transport system permease protein